MYEYQKIAAMNKYQSVTDQVKANVDKLESEGWRRISFLEEVNLTRLVELVNIHYDQKFVAETLVKKWPGTAMLHTHKGVVACGCNWTHEWVHELLLVEQHWRDRPKDAQTFDDLLRALKYGLFGELDKVYNFLGVMELERS